MTELVRSFLAYFRTRAYRKERRVLPPITFADMGNDTYGYYPAVFARICEEEAPVLRHAGDLFGFNRTVHVTFEGNGYMNNHTPDYA
jgi:hypothetical protein